MQQKRIFILISAIVLAISTSAKVGAIDLNRPHGEHEHEKEKEKENRQKYTCPMHPEIIMDHPGNCPKCGMKLVLKKKATNAKAKNDARESRNIQKMHANHEMHQHHGDETMPRESHQMHSMQGHEPHDMSHMQMSMQSSVDLTDPMSREGSGKSWLPDSSPMYGNMFMFGDDMLMLHGAIFRRYPYVRTRRGRDRMAAPSWT